MSLRTRSATTPGFSQTQDPGIHSGVRLPQPGGMPARQPEEVHALIESAANAGDIDAFVAAYAEDATLIVPPEGERVTGHDEIRRALADTIAQAPPARMEVVEKLQSDGLALTHARWTLGELSGRGTIVSRREPDGHWLIVLDNPMSPD